MAYFSWGAAGAANSPRATTRHVPRSMGNPPRRRGGGSRAGPLERTAGPIRWDATLALHGRPRTGRSGDHSKPPPRRGEAPALASLAPVPGGEGSGVRGAAAPLPSPPPPLPRSGGRGENQPP